MSPDGKFAKAGYMSDAAEQTVLLDGSASDAAAVGITVEPEGGSEQPTTEPIALFDLHRRKREWRGPATCSRSRLRRRGPDRRLDRLPHQPRHPLRGRRPPRRARRHPPGADARGRAGDRHRLHRPQPTHLPDAAAPVRGAGHRDPAVGDVALGERRRHRCRVRRCARRRAACSPSAPRCARSTTGRCWSRSRGSTVGPRPCWPPTRVRPARRPDAARVPRRRRLHARIRPSLHGAARRRRVVVRPGDLARLPRALPLHLPRAPRDARRLRLARVAHRHRWLGHLRRRDRCGAAGDPPRDQGDLGPRARRRRGDHRRQRRDDRLRRRRDRHAPGPGARHARVAHRPPARAAVRAPLQQQPGPAPHRRVAAPRRSCCAGLVELPPPGGRDRCRHGDLRPHPPAAAPHRHPLPRHPRRRGPGGPGPGHRPDGVRAPALHARVGRRLAPAAGDRQRPGRLRRGLPRLGLPRGRRALRPGRRHPPRPALDPHHARAPEAGPLRDDDPPHPADPLQADLRARLHDVAGRRRRPPGPRQARHASRRATTSARPSRRSATTSRRSSPTTASCSARAGDRARS